MKSTRYSPLSYSHNTDGDTTTDIAAALADFINTTAGLERFAAASEGRTLVIFDSNGGTSCNGNHHGMVSSSYKNIMDLLSFFLRREELLDNEKEPIHIFFVKQNYFGISIEIDEIVSNMIKELGIDDDSDCTFVGHKNLFLATLDLCLDDAKVNQVDKRGDSLLNAAIEHSNFRHDLIKYVINLSALNLRLLCNDTEHSPLSKCTATDYDEVIFENYWWIFKHFILPRSKQDQQEQEQQQQDDNRVSDDGDQNVVDCFDDNGSNLLMVACFDCDVDAVKILFDEYDADVNIRRPSDSEKMPGATPLHWLVDKCDKGYGRDKLSSTYRELLELFLKHPNIDVNAQYDGGCTPLFVAAVILQRVPIVQLMLESRDDFNLDAKVDKYHTFSVRRLLHIDIDDWYRDDEEDKRKCKEICALLRKYIARTEGERRTNEFTSMQ